MCSSFSLLCSCWYETNCSQWKRVTRWLKCRFSPLVGFRTRSFFIQSSVLVLDTDLCSHSSLWSAEAAQPDCLPAERHHGKRRKVPPAAGDNEATSLPGMWRQGGADRKRKWSLLPPLQGGGVKGHGRVSGSHLSGRYHGDDTETERWGESLPAVWVFLPITCVFVSLKSISTVNIDTGRVPDLIHVPLTPHPLLLLIVSSLESIQTTRRDGQRFSTSGQRAGL